MRWTEVDWKRRHPEGSVEMLDQMLHLIDEQSLDVEVHEFMEEDKPAVNGGQCLVLHEHTYAAQVPEGQTAFAINSDALPEAEFWHLQDPGPFHTPPHPNDIHFQDLEEVEITTFNPLEYALPYHGNLKHSRGENPVLTSGERKAKNIKETERKDAAYIKKPLNAFMIYMKWNRTSTEAELGVRTSAVVNKHLGEKWKLLSPEEKEIYYTEAKVEAHLHSVQNPGWSNKVNYRNKRKRSRTKKAPAPEMPGSPPQLPTYWTCKHGHQQTLSSSNSRP